MSAASADAVQGESPLLPVIDHAVGALAVLFVLKVGLIAAAVTGPERWTEPAALESLAPLVFGWDVVGAAAVGLAAGLAARLWRGWRRTDGARIAAAVQVAHAVIAVVGTISVWQLGGPLTRQAIASFFYQSGNAPGAILDSVRDFASPVAMTALVGVPLLGAALPPRFARVRRRIPWPVASLAGLLATALVAGTLVLLPALERGDFGWKRRIFPGDLHRSPAVELFGSYGKALLRTFAAGSSVTRGLSTNLDSLESPGSFETPLARAKAAPTDVVFVMLESIGSTYVDAEPPPMPFLKSLTARPNAVVFERHYTTWCLTTKVFFSFFCSELPYPTFQPITRINPGIPCVSVTQALSRAGFETAFITSLDLDWDQQRRFFRHRSLDRAWDMDDQPGHASAWKDGWGIDDRLTVKNALDVLGEPRSRPLFLLVNFRAGHHPYDALPEHAKQKLPTRRERYLRALGVADDRIRDLVEGLERAGRLSRTLLVVASDHGEGVEGPPERRGRNVYEDSARVPMVVLGPQLDGVTGTVQEVTSHLDLSPTLLGLLGVPVPCTMRGRDLTRTARRAIAYVGGRPPRFQLGLIDGRFKVVVEEGGGHALYDLEADPRETIDVAAEHRDRTDRLLHRVEQIRADSEVIIEEYAARLAASDCRP